VSDTPAFLSRLATFGESSPHPRPPHGLRVGRACWHHRPMILDWLHRALAAWRGDGIGGDDRADAASPRPFVRRSWRHVSLQFTRTEAQSRMLAWRPDQLVVDYTRTMMGVLLFRPQPGCIGMVGLGGGSQAKFCYRHLPRARIEVVEISPEVVALRDAFRVPRDDGRFRVVVDDGARFVRACRGRFDVLLVDGYDAAGIAPALSTPEFYADCRAALADDGVMAVNLFGDDWPRHLAMIRHAFGRSVLAVREPRQSNRVVFAWVGQPIPPEQWPALRERRAARTLDRRARRQLAPVFDRIAAAAATEPEAFR
jgi:spermidine synthase